jgi:drug/metabolite transporter (DMT)-like permease
MRATFAYLRRGSLWAVGCLVVGIGIFSLQDVIIKLMSANYPVHQAMLIRSVVAMPLLILITAVEGNLVRLLSPHWLLLAGRGVIHLLSYTTYYLGLAALPLATSVALFFTAPLFITLLAAVALKENVGPKRWTAVIVGFIGVLVVVQPGSEVFDWVALLPVCSGLTYGAAQVLARRIGRSESAAVMASYSNLVFLFGATAMAALFATGGFPEGSHASLAFLLRGWTTPSAKDLLLMMSCGVIAAVALTLLTEAYRSAPANTVAPFEYSALGWGVLFGWLAWEQYPGVREWLGILTIIGAGIYVLYHDSIGLPEARRASTKRVLPAGSPSADQN